MAMAGRQDENSSGPSKTSPVQGPDDPAWLWTTHGALTCVAVMFRAAGSMAGARYTLMAL